MHRYSFEDGARLLTSSLALPDLTPAQALRVVPFMKLTLAPRGAVLFRAGGPGSQFMVMLLNRRPRRSSPIITAVIVGVPLSAITRSGRTH